MPLYYYVTLDNNKNDDGLDNDHAMKQSRKDSIRSPTKKFKHSDASSDFPIDILEQENSYTMDIEFPGISKDNIKLEVDNDNVLTIEATKASRFDNTETNESKENVPNARYLRRERRVGKFQRAIQLPKDADASNIQASFTDGLLSLQINRKQQSLPIQITLQ